MDFYFWGAWLYSGRVLGEAALCLAVVLGSAQGVQSSAELQCLCHLPVVALWHPQHPTGSSGRRVWCLLWGSQCRGGWYRGPVRKLFIVWGSAQGTKLVLLCLLWLCSPTGWLPIGRAAKPSLDLLIRWCHESGPVCLHWPWCLSKLIPAKNRGACAGGAGSHSLLQGGHPCLWSHLRKNTGKWSLEPVWELLCAVPH